MCAPDHVFEVGIAAGHDVGCRIADLHAASIVESSGVPAVSTNSKASVPKTALT
jgi:hypothetical protein